MFSGDLAVDAESVEELKMAINRLLQYCSEN
jgi:hypothetical protein